MYMNLKCIRYTFNPNVVCHDAHNIYHSFTEIYEMSLDVSARRSLVNLHPLCGHRLVEQLSSGLVASNL